MIRCPDNQINASFIDISRIKWLVFFYCGRLSSAQLVPLQAPKHRPIISPHPVEQTEFRRGIKDYKSVFTNLCLELQQNRSWIKGLGKNPQKSELVHWRQCLLSGGTEACSLGLRETPACIHVIQRLSQPRVACWQASGKTLKKRNACLHAVRQAVAKKIACLNGLRSEGVN